MCIQNNIPEYTPIIELRPNGTSSYIHLMKDCIIENKEFEEAYHFYINLIYYDKVFLRAMYAILVDKDAFYLERVGCYYPEWNSPDPELYFEGVRFEIGGISEIECRADVPEEVAFFYLKRPVRGLWNYIRKKNIQIIYSQCWIIGNHCNAPIALMFTLVLFNIS